MATRPINTFVAGNNALASEVNSNFTEVWSFLDFIKEIPAYEDVVAGDLLKPVSVTGNYKLRKLKGIKSNITGSAVSTSKAIMIDADTIVVLYLNGSYNPVVVAGNISGTSITWGTPVQVAAYNNSGLNMDIVKTADNKFVVFYMNATGGPIYTIYSKKGSTSGNTVTIDGTELTVKGSMNALPTIKATNINTDKTSLVYYYSGVIYARIFDNSGTYTQGTEASQSAGNYTGMLSSVKVNTDVFAFTFNENAGYNLNYAVCTVSGTTITIGSVGTLIDGTVSNTVLTTYFAYVDANHFLISYVESGSSGVVKLAYVTRSTGTLTPSGTTQNTTTNGPIIIYENFVYLLNTTTVYKYHFNSSGFYLAQSADISNSALYGLDIYNDSIIAYVNTTNYANFLLDHSEFVVSPNASYSTGVNIPIKPVYSGFASLIHGVDYYINASASGITPASTYGQKVGRAINDSTVLKWI